MLQAHSHRAERYLWSDKGERALNYLQQSRRLSADTIRYAPLGFCPGWYSESLTSWGLTSIQTLEEEEIKIPPGITIPWIVENKIWKISVKRFEDVEKGYFQVVGSSDALYTIDTSQGYDTPCMLLESEFDALSVQQEAGDIIASVATGGTSKGQSLRWINQLIQVPGILIGFDADEAGNAGSANWLKKIPDALRWQPWAHDANQMLQDNINIRTWVEMGLRALHTQIEIPVEVFANSVKNIPEPFQSPALLIGTSKEAVIKRTLDPWIK